MSSSGGSRGGASVTQGTAAAKPGSPLPNQLYFATDTGEWWVGNTAGNAWQSLAQTSAGTWKAGGNSAVLGAAFNGQTGTGAFGSFAFTASGSQWVSSHSIDIGTAGAGLMVKEGANCKQGVSGAMVAGAVTVANTSVTANSKIICTRAPGGTNPGAVYVSAITAGTSFVITSTNAADTGTVFYEIFEPG